MNDSLIPLRQILGAAVREGVLANNPAKNDDRDHPLELPYERPTMHFLNREQALAHLDSCAGWYRTLAETLIGAGLRIGGAIALEWRDVDWDNSALEVSRAAKDKGEVGAPKGDRSRSVLLAPYLLDLLREHRANQAAAGGLGKLVFRSPEGLMLNRHNVRRRGHDIALEDAGVSPLVRLHDLRHGRDPLARCWRVDLLRPAAARPRRHSDDYRPVRAPRRAGASGGGCAGRRVVARRPGTECSPRLSR